MPTTRLPLTPASSTEIAAMEKSGLPLPGADQFFALPPAAIPSSSSSSSANKHNNNNKHNNKHESHLLSPTSPPQLQQQERLSPQTRPRPARQRSATKRPAPEFDLPPPPTRTRKIIQMKPKTQAQSQTQSQPRSSTGSKSRETTASNNSTSGGNGTAAVAATPASPDDSPTGPSAKKQKTTASTAAGRKIARKTAHSLIERRRRSKMNEEFATLKDMIPACKGQDMHKLAILQASIEYMNYLEQCLSDLKAANRRRGSSASLNEWTGPSADAAAAGDNSDDAYSSSQSSTLEQSPAQPMGMSPTPNHQFYIHPQLQQHTPIEPSPRLPPFDMIPMTLPSPILHMSKDSSLASQQQLPSLPKIASSAPGSGVRTARPSFSHSACSSTLPSPAILPQSGSRSRSQSQSQSQTSHRPDVDMDREATTALLMLNSVSRRDHHGPMAAATEKPATKKVGMSVHDLIS